MRQLGKVSYQRKGEAYVQYGTIIDSGIVDIRSGEVFKDTISWMNYIDFRRIQNSREVPWSIINTNKIIDYEHYTIIVAPKTDYELLMSYLPSKYQKRIVSAEKLSTAWIETRTQREMEIYQQLVAITHQIIEDAFSEKVITPGVTTTTDVERWG